MLMRKWLFFLIGFNLSAIALSGQSVDLEKRDSLWQLVGEQVQDEASLPAALDQLRRLEAAYASSGAPADFYQRAIPALKTAYEAGHFDFARAHLRRLARQAENWPAGEEPLRGEALYQIGRSYYFTGELDSVRHYVHWSLSCYPAGSPLATWHFNLLGAAATADHQLDSAVHHYREAIQRGASDPGFDFGYLGIFHSNLGNALHDLGQVGEALDAYQRSIALQTAAWGENDPEVAASYNNLGAFYLLMGRNDAAIPCYREALRIYTELGQEESAQTANTFHNLAVSHKQNGAYEDALTYFRQAELIYEGAREENAAELAQLYSNRANVYSRLQAYSAAIADHRRAAVINERQALWPGLAGNHTNLGMVYYQQGQWRQALAEHEKALDLLRELPDYQRDWANGHVNLADAYRQLGQAALARAHADSAMRIQEQLFGRRNANLAYTYLTQARIEQAEGNPMVALQWVQRALVANHRRFGAEQLVDLPDLDGYFNYEYLLAGLRLKAELLRELYPDEPTYQQLVSTHYEWAMQLLEEVRDELTNREDQLALVRQVYELAKEAIGYYHGLAEMTRDQRWLTYAFTFSEKSKASVLLGAIATNEARYFAGIPDSLLAREDQLRADIGFYKRAMLEEGIDSLRHIAYGRALFQRQEAYKALLRRYERDFPLYYDLKHAREIPRPSAIQFALAEEQALLSYFTADSVIYAFLLTKTDFQVHAGPVSDRFYREITGYRKGIFRGPTSLYLDKAVTLHEQLFPFDLPEGVRELILAPDGGLLLAPFEALLTRPVDVHAPAGFSELPYLIRDYAIRYTPSATLFYQYQTTATLTPGTVPAEGLLAVAPVFSGPAAGAPHPTAHRLLKEYIPALPYSAQEVERIARLFSAEGLPARARTYADARESELKGGDVKSARYLHIATHGIINELEPDLSGLLLYPDSLAGEDGFLSVGEIYNLRLNADLVVLSACETATGRIVTGEGVLGFVQAFLYAGADQLLVSLWQVADEATAELMTDFYQRMLGEEGSTTSEQLRATKLRLIQDGRFGHPRYWSAFILLGG